MYFNPYPNYYYYPPVPYQPHPYYIPLPHYYSPAQWYVVTGAVGAGGNQPERGNENENH